MSRVFRLPAAAPRPAGRSAGTRPPASDPTAAPAPTVSSYRGMVASPHHLASQAGLRALQDGGSAVDAAIAANLVLSVAHPDMCGVGGDLYALVLPAGASRPVALNAAGRGGPGHVPERFAARHGGRMPTYGPGSLIMPGAPAGWVALHERFGRLPFERLVEDAAGYATDGVPCPERLVRSLVHWAPELQTVEVGAPGAPPAVGARLRLPRYGRTLAALGRDGAAAFYEGVGGRELERVAEGLVTTEAMAAFRPEWVEPLEQAVLGRRWWTVPAPSQAYIALLAGAILEHLAPGTDPDDPELWHLMIEATKAASRDRDLVLGDIGRTPPPLAEAAERAATIGPRAAAFATPADPGDTVYLCAVDAEGQAVSLSQSLFHPWGSRVELPASGVIVQNRGSSFSLVPGHPNEMAPGRRPRSTLSPTVVTGDTGLEALIGTMGGDVQPHVVLQLFVKVLHCGLGPAAALAHPRYFLHRGLAPTIWSGEIPVVGVEARGRPEVADDLARRGHPVAPGDPWVELAGHAQVITAEGGRLTGAADPRSGVGGVAAW